jgi:hypothetical protein
MHPCRSFGGPLTSLSELHIGGWAPRCRAPQDTFGTERSSTFEALSGFGAAGIHGRRVTDKTVMPRNPTRLIKPTRGREVSPRGPSRPSADGERMRWPSADPATSTPRSGFGERIPTDRHALTKQR